MFCYFIVPKHQNKKDDYCDFLRLFKRGKTVGTVGKVWEKSATLRAWKVADTLYFLEMYS